MNDYVKISGNKIITLLAISQYEQECGLMNQEWPPPVMSFVYATPRINKFWMKNTPSPLDIVFANQNKIIAICYGEPFSTRIIGDDRFSNLVVEFPAGTCKSLGINVGDSIELECSEKSLMRIFMQKNGFSI